VPAPERAAAARLPEALGWVFIAVALPLIGLTRINPPDIPWHLATARLAEALGHWPVRNSFSWTFPDYTLYQQYPVFQSIAHGAFRLGGWEALSVLVFAWWAVVFLLFVRAAGPLSRAVPFHTFWALVAFSIQTRAALRPDLLSLSFVALFLIIFDAYRERHRGLIALVPAVHWLWANGHQLFILSFVLQGLFLGHLLLARWGRLGVDRRDAGVPSVPVLAALGASVALSFATPLGTEIMRVFAHTSGSLAAHRDDVQELARVWSDPVWLVIGLAITVPTAALLVRSWRSWSPLDVGLFVVACALAVSAIRGLVYATLVSGAVFQRTLLRQPIGWRPSPVLTRYFRGLGTLVSAALAFAVLWHHWLNVTPTIGGSQPGLGRSEGDWPDAALATLKADPPPGRMMNLSWSAANGVMWDWPEQPVFVDPRFEAYPRSFLIDAMKSRSDDAVLARLIARHRPSWLYVEHCSRLERARIAHLVRGGGWQLTYADPLIAVLVARTPATEAYRARHPFAPAPEPPGLVRAPAGRRARQRLCFGSLLGTLGHLPEARAQLAEARREAGDEEELAEALEKAAQALPSGTTAQ
jgi:hypothetical protein